jgi:AraC family transcriptional regulator
MNQPQSAPELSPRYETSAEMLIAGLSAHYSTANAAGISAQWWRFAPSIGSMPGKIGTAAYGVIYNGDDDRFDYLTGVQVANSTALPTGFTHLSIPARRYAVFCHRGHVSNIRNTMEEICGTWLPELDGERGAPSFERYGDDFDPVTGLGIVEIWIPLKR